MPSTLRGTALHDSPEIDSRPLYGVETGWLYSVTLWIPGLCLLASDHWV